MPQLDFATFPSQLFWLAVTFITMFIMMSRFALPRITEVMETRQERIANDLETAEQQRREADAIEADYEKALTDARTTAQARLKEVMETLESESAEKEAAAAAKLTKIQKEAENRIAKSRKETLAHIREVAAEVSIVAVERLAGAKVKGAKAASVAAGVEVKS